MPPRVFDSEAFETLVARAREAGEVTLTFPTSREAGYFRHTFYLWRAQQRQLGSPIELSDIVIRRPEPSVIIVTSGWRDPILRRALCHDPEKTT